MSHVALKLVIAASALSKVAGYGENINPSACAGQATCLSFSGGEEFGVVDENGTTTSCAFGQTAVNIEAFERCVVPCQEDVSVSYSVSYCLICSPNRFVIV